MNDTICSTLSRIHIHKEEAPQEAQAPLPRKPQTPQYTTNKAQLNADGTPMMPPTPPMGDGMDKPKYIDPSQQQMPRIPIVNTKTPRPNDPCPCGSGKKYKHCVKG